MPKSETKKIGSLEPAGPGRGSRGREVDLVADRPAVPAVELDLVADQPVIPPRLHIDDEIRPGETRLQCLRRLRDEAERARLSTVHGSRFHQSRLATEQDIAKT